MIDKPLYGNPLAGGNLLLQRPADENIERQYFYNKDLNKLFNMPGGVRMAAPKGFESVNKNRYEDFASKGATLQGYERFNDAMGGGYNLDLPRDEFGVIDRTSSEYDYFYGDSQQKPNIGAGILGNTNPSILPFPGMDSTETAPSPDTIVSPLQSMSPSETNPYNRVGQQLTGPDQFDDLNSRLNKLEEGIGSLLNQNRGFGFNSMQPRYGAPNYGYSPFSMTGLGSLFGGYYG